MNDDKQTTLPGTERRPGKAAQLRADAPLRGKVPQKLEPGGPLFTHEEDRRQGDLLERI